MTGGTVAEMLTMAAGRLAAVGIEQARAEARLLVGHALGAAPEALIAHPEGGVGGPARSRVDALVRRRIRREPMSHLLGRREFWGLEFRVNRHVLDPRPDSESVVEAVLAAIGNPAAGLRILDLGTGTGCLLLALLSELPGALGTGVDVSAGAASVAWENAVALGLGGRARFVVGDWGAAINGGFQVIVANPPYVASGEVAALAPEIRRFEPAVALDGGPDGLRCYHDLAPAIGRLLAPGGFAVIEIGYGQAADIKEIFLKSWLQVRHVRRDLAGIDRCLMVDHAAELTVI